MVYVPEGVFKLCGMGSPCYKQVKSNPGHYKRFFEWHGQWVTDRQALGLQFENLANGVISNAFLAFCELKSSSTIKYPEFERVKSAILQKRSQINASLLIFPINLVPEDAPEPALVVLTTTVNLIFQVACHDAVEKLVGREMAVIFSLACGAVPRDGQVWSTLPGMERVCRDPQTHLKLANGSEFPGPALFNLRKLYIALRRAASRPTPDILKDAPLGEYSPIESLQLASNGQLDLSSFVSTARSTKADDSARHNSASSSEKRNYAEQSRDGMLNPSTCQSGQSAATSDETAMVSAAFRTKEGIERALVEYLAPKILNDVDYKFELGSMLWSGCGRKEFLERLQDIYGEMRANQAHNDKLEQLRLEGLMVIETTKQAMEATKQSMETTKQAVEATKQAMAEEATKQAMAEEATKKAVAEEATKQAMEATKQAVAEEATKQAMAEEATKKAVAEEATKKAVAEETTKQAMDATKQAMAVLEGTIKQEKAVESRKRKEMENLYHQQRLEREAAVVQAAKDKKHELLVIEANTRGYNAQHKLTVAMSLAASRAQLPPAPAVVAVSTAAVPSAVAVLSSVSSAAVAPQPAAQEKAPIIVGELEVDVVVANVAAAAKAAARAAKATAADAKATKARADAKARAAAKAVKAMAMKKARADAKAAKAAAAVATATATQNAATESTESEVLTLVGKKRCMEKDGDGPSTPAADEEEQQQRRNSKRPKKEESLADRAARAARGARIAAHLAAEEGAMAAVLLPSTPWQPSLESMDLVRRAAKIAQDAKDRKLKLRLEKADDAAAAAVAVATHPTTNPTTASYPSRSEYTRSMDSRVAAFTVRAAARGETEMVKLIQDAIQNTNYERLAAQHQQLTLLSAQRFTVTANQAAAQAADQAAAQAAVATSIEAGGAQEKKIRWIARKSTGGLKPRTFLRYADVL